MINKLKDIFWDRICRIIWKKKNRHNMTRLGCGCGRNILRLISSERLSVGKSSYGTLNIAMNNNESEELHIGSYCSISNCCKFLLGGEHDYNYISTYPIFEKKGKKSAKTKGPIVIHDDVWIGDNALILSGVEIGQGAVIGAGAVVASNIPPYAIAVGNPAKVIKYRFEEDVIKKLISVNFSELDLNKNMDFEVIRKDNVDNEIAKVNVIK